EARADALGRATLEPQPVLPAELGAARRGHLFRIGTPAGTTWHAHFDLEDGRLHALSDRSVGRGTWVRYGRWREFDGLTLPTLRVQGIEGVPVLGTLRIDEVVTGKRLPEELFAGDPLPRRAPFALGSPLAILPGAIPGSAHLVLPRVIVHGARGRHAAPALL